MSYAETANNAGLVVTRRIRQTGLLVSVYRAEEAAIDPNDGGPWAVVCEPHGGLVQTDTREQAEGLLAEMGDWCPTCQEIRDAADRLTITKEA